MEPLILLYVTDEQVEISNGLRASLSRTGVKFDEKNVSSNPAHHADLIKRFGGEVSIPGIQVDDMWVAADDGNIEEVVGQYWIDKLLGSKPGNERSSSSSDPNGLNDITFDSRDLRDRPAVTAKSLFLGDGEMIRDSASCNNSSASSFQYDDPTTTVESETSELSPVATAFDDVVLPSKTKIAYCVLVRMLRDATKHHVEHIPGRSYRYFRGHEGMKIWSRLFFDDQKTSDDELIQFGQDLINYGIVHNYQAHSGEDFRSSYLVLQPFFEPHILNSFVRWPQDHSSCNDDPMDVILRLSRDMDEICAIAEWDEDRTSRFQAFEENVCQLQVIGFPLDAIEKVTFALNLFNLMVRHAMLLSEERKWSWPTDLESLDKLFSTIGYSVGGEYHSLSILKACLYGRSDTVLPNLIQDKNTTSFWDKFLCRRPPTANDYHYERGVVRNDPRVLFAMTWGTVSSPVVSTIYPNRLGEGLQTAAEAFLMHNVQVGPGKVVVLPALLSWFRADFGYEPEQVLFNILHFMSPDQLSRLRALKDGGKIDIRFDTGGYQWAPGLPSYRRLRETVVMDAAATPDTPVPPVTPKVPQSSNCPPSPHPAAAAVDDIANRVLEKGTSSRYVRRASNENLAKIRILGRSPSPSSPKKADHDDIDGDGSLLSKIKRRNRHIHGNSGGTGRSIISAGRRLLVCRRPSVGEVQPSPHHKPYARPGVATTTTIRPMTPSSPKGRSMTSSSFFAPKAMLPPSPQRTDQSDTDDPSWGFVSNDDDDKDLEMDYPEYHDDEEDEEGLFDYDDDDAGRSYSQSYVSEITYGSEFEDLLLMSSRRGRRPRQQPLRPLDSRRPQAESYDYPSSSSMKANPRPTVHQHRNMYMW